MSSFNESVGLGYLKTNAIEFVKYPLILLPQFGRNGCKCRGENIFICVEMLKINPLIMTNLESIYIFCIQIKQLIN